MVPLYRSAAERWLSRLAVDRIHTHKIQRRAPVLSRLPVSERSSVASATGARAASSKGPSTDSKDKVLASGGSSRCRSPLHRRRPFHPPPPTAQRTTGGVRAYSKQQTAAASAPGRRGGGARAERVPHPPARASGHAPDSCHPRRGGMARPYQPWQREDRVSSGGGGWELAVLSRNASLPGEARRGGVRSDRRKEGSGVCRP